MEIVLVAAMDRDGTIGKDGGLPWRLPADLAHFKKVTTGHPVIMGRKTSDTLPRPLPGRRNIVLTRTPGFARPGFEVAHTPEEALDLVRGCDAAMIAGGAAIYGLFLPLATRFELTLVDASIGGDTRFPPWNTAEWIEIGRHDVPADATNPYAMSFLSLVRRR